MYTESLACSQFLVKIPFINKGIDFIDLPSIFQDKSVIQSIPTYFQNSEPPIICYKYNKPIRNTIFNFNKLVSDLDIHAPAEHIVTGNLKIISDSRIRKIVSKGPKYRFLPSYINFDKCREEIASAFNDFGNRWCKREGVEDNALKEWKKVSSLSWINVLSFIHKILIFYLLNPNRHLGISSRVSKNFIESMSWFRQIKPLTMLLSFVGFTTLTH